ncbi:MAG: glycosyltransferase family 4 protein [Chloroflexota bacterium]
MEYYPLRRSLNIGFISTRLAGTDGVSLETTKWAEVLEMIGHKCFYFSGLSDRPDDVSMVVPEAYYRHPDVEYRHAGFFGTDRRTPEDTEWIHDWRVTFKNHLYDFINQFELDILIPENLFAIPLQIPLALALTEVIAETGIPTIAHHHDFAWERKRFLVNGIEDYLASSFPPELPSIQHVVINSQGRSALARRRGVSSVIIPNVMHYEKQPIGIDDYSADLRQTLGIREDEIFILQPTRVVQRKGIEHAIELVQRLDRDAVLVISHASGDEGDEYEQRLQEYARLLNVRTLFCDEHFDEYRRTSPDGQKIYGLNDAYPHADLVTYPSVFEGFGNAFLEAVYFKKPIVVNNYSIYATDIRPLGFQVVEFDDYVTEETVAHTERILDNPDLVNEMVETNYQLAMQFFSYRVLWRNLDILIANISGTRPMFALD